ncbi:hypothetical protein M2396_002727 [Pseudomonas sp. BIGb0278]|uniref:hypothetical protein n=1 Tax=Pseudomonas sp. BIGb0278 TaxID=2940607 RepID=UPI002169ACCE|nr:hypothetical protein [Pseudomonas sp. BIGb0278]MCS4284431.1 hypothetical protein [Pseudomonas sp. BIGb0278]
MSHQFKPGDLAMTLVGIPGHIESGAAVEVESILRPGDIVRYRGERREIAKPQVLVMRDGSKYSYHPHQLIPLRGDLAPEQQKAKEAEPCA